jgi:hypothetical protein
MIALTTTTDTRTATSLTLRAPALKPVADALLALHGAPDDSRAFIVVALLHKEGADRCPCCTTTFTITDVSETRWSGGSVQRLSCPGCQSDFVVSEDACC